MFILFILVFSCCLFSFNNSWALSLYHWWWSLLFGFTLVLVVTSVLVFSSVYLSAEKLGNFYFWFWCFVASMLVLVFANSLFLSFVGWEGLGVSSFFLILFYESNYSVASAFKTMTMNKVGDFFFILVLVAGYFGGVSTGLMLGCFVVFCFSKSAIFPFSFWLPSAMAAPTPVSALVHSSTLVTAGLWVMYQYLLLFEGLMGFLVFGLVTGLVGGLAASVEEDVKKIIAYSTLSQLGFMLVVMGISFELSFIHLLTHAFFKSSLFISFGLTIMLNHSQSEANFSAEGGAGMKLLGMLSIFSLISFPFYLSFFSKHLVLSSMSCWSSSFLMLMCLGTYILMVTAYSIRLLKTLVKAGSVSISTGVLSWLVVFTLFMTIFNYQAVFFSGFFSNSVGTGSMVVLVSGFIVLGLKGFKIMFLMQQVFFQKMLSWNSLKFVVSSSVISMVDWIYVSIANTLKFEAVVMIVGCLALFL